MDVNYFVCTLGQAALPGIDRPFRDVDHLIDQQALHAAVLPAVGFYVLDRQHQSFDAQILTFHDVLRVTSAVANTIAESVDISPRQTVGLLSNSSPAFLFTWLALMRLGHHVLLIAPQCSASAIAHLSKTCDAPMIFYDEAHENLAREAVSASPGIGFLGMSNKPLPFEDDDEIFKLPRKEFKRDIRHSPVSSNDVAYLHHTSGTSTGMPKPIPQTHKGGVGVLPSLNGSSAATFTTTPLYHGGVADLFRAWSSSAMIWLFPSQHVPITAANIVKCLAASKEAAKAKQAPFVRYFSSVPYVLQMMAEDRDGLRHLQSMDIVGVGGAALPPEVGNKLVNDNVNLVSRYGSAECGFLMSSHRDYAKDAEWQYLRKSEQVEQLKFEAQSDRQSELIVLPGWPHMAKTNRNDGSFTTSDLFAPHPTILNAWKYHSRADSQLTLITGKKFDPSPLEGSLAASLTMISDVLIFGNGKPYPGALFFRSEEARDRSDEELVTHIAPMVENLNRESQAHARIPRNMLIPIPYEKAPLEKSSKGTILRGRAEDKFGQQIEDAYKQTNFSSEDAKDEDISSAILKIVKLVVGDSHQVGDALTEDTELFSYGVDSVACVQIRHGLTQLLPDSANSLPLTIVEDSGTVARLTEIVRQRRRGETAIEIENQSQLLSHMIDKYSAFDDVVVQDSEVASDSTKYNILLTGPTGLLGSFVLSQLLSNQQVKKIYLLVRGASQHAAEERVLKALVSRQLPVPSGFDQRVLVMPCKLSEPRLGLSDDDHQLLATEVDKIFHLAWAVNFLVSLRSLGSTHLAGLQNLLGLARTAKRCPEFLFCSSVASVSNFPGSDKIPESIVEELSACGPTGYAQSKLAAELICNRYASSPGVKNRITLIRVGQLSGDTKNGVWNMSEAYPLLLASSKATGILPDLKDEILGWLPVDIAAQSFIEAAFSDKPQGASHTRPTNGTTESSKIRVLNLLNTSKATKFEDLTRFLHNAEEEVKVVSVQEWLSKLSSLRDEESTKNHSALKLLPFWQEVYGHGSPAGSSKVEQAVQGVQPSNGVDTPSHDDDYATTLSKAAMPSLAAAIGPLKEEYVLHLWNWIKNHSDKED